MNDHLAPENCYVCGYPESMHHSSASHKFWSNADAAAEEKKEHEKYGTDRQTPEARYVEEYRPY